MTRAATATALTALLCAALTSGCSSDDTSAPAAAPTSAEAATSAAPSPTADDRRGCRAVAALGAVNHDPTANRDAGALAAEAVDPGIRQAGIDLVKAATRAQADPGDETNLGLNAAQRLVAVACAEAFGEGPW